ncbi:MAG: phosphopantetheine-binding protein [Polyangiaceae bacterium]
MEAVFDRSGELSPRARAFELRARLVDRVRALLVDDLSVRLPAEAIDPDAPLFNVGVGLDSVDAIELAFAIERTFGVTLPEGEAFGDAARSVNRIVDQLVARGVQ